MKFSYKQRKLYFNLGLGILWLVIFMMHVLTNDQLRPLDFIWLFVALLYFGLYYYQKSYGYVRFMDGKIEVDGPLGKKASISDVQRIKKFAGEYILKTANKELRINTQLMTPLTKEALTQELEKLDVEWDNIAV